MTNDLLAPADWLVGALDLGLLALCCWALVDAAVRPAPAFVAAGKLTKPAWVAILALCVAAVLVLGASLLGLGAFTAVAALVYLVDVRPAVREMRPGGPWA